VSKVFIEDLFCRKRCSFMSLWHGFMWS